MSRKGVIEVEVVCGLDEEDLKPWEELTPEQQEKQKGTNPGCEGHGDFGGLCIGCHFCVDWDMTDAYQIETGGVSDGGN